MLITFIGGGNMATALVSGLVNPPRAHIRIRVSDPNEGARKHLESTFRVPTFTDSRAAVQDADVVLMAVKPQIMPLVLDELRGHVGPEQLVMSIAAGTTMDMIRQRLGKETRIVRSMPNTPALIGHGITGAVAGSGCSREQRQQAEEILMAAGDVVWLEDESLMDAVTAISGTGPAYFFFLTEALAEAAREMGLPEETADRLASATCFGAGAMLASSPGEAADLRRRVTSPNGTTHAAITLLREEGYRELVKRAAEAARRRSRELSGESS